MNLTKFDIDAIEAMFDRKLDEKLAPIVKDISELKASVAAQRDFLIDRFSALSVRFTQLDDGIKDVKVQLTSIENRLDGHDVRLNNLDNQVDGIQHHLSAIDKTLSSRASWIPDSEING